PGVWRHYERQALEGLVALGHAGCTFNPVYGQGLTVAAFGARALWEAAWRDRPRYGAGRRRGVAVVTKNPWVLSSSKDVRFETTTGGASGALVRAQHRFLDWVLVRAT